MKNVFYDIEVFKDFFLVSFLTDDGFSDFSFHKKINERELDKLRSFIIKLRKEKTTCIGYNILKYDNQVIKYAIGPENKTLADIHNLNLKAINEETFPEDIGLNCIDLIPFFKIGSHFKSLKEVGADIGAENIMECSISFEQEETSKEDINIITEYCHNDVLLVKAIFDNEKVKDEVAVRKLISESYNIPIKKALTRSVGTLSDKVIDGLLGHYTKSEPELNFNVKDILDKRLSYKTDVFNALLDRVGGWQIVQEEGSSIIKDSQGIELKLGRGVVKIGLGGVHYNVEDTFIFKDKKDYILDIDVKSYYPSLIRNLNLGPEGIEKEYSDVFKKLINLRDNAKTKGESALYKLVLNSATGKLKSQYSLFYSPKCNTSITINGQMIMMELVEALHFSGFVFAQINTDGLSIFMSPDKRAECDKIVDEWKKKWGFVTTEAVYNKVVQRDVNNYIAIKEDGTAKKTGFFKPGNLNLYPVVVKAVTDKLVNDTEPSLTISKAEDADFIRYAKRNRWSWNGDEVFNKHGVNRFYIAKDVENVLYSVLPPLKDKKEDRMIKVVENVKSANNLKDISNIDKKAYELEVSENLSDYANAKLPVYNADCHIVEPGVKPSKTLKNGSKMRDVLIDMGLLKKRGKVLSECPMCGSKSNACKIFDEEHIYCFSCQKKAGIEEIDKQIINIQPKLEMPVFEEIKKVENNDEWSIPDIVWQGYVADVAKAVGKRNVDSLFVALSSAAILIQRDISVLYGGGLPVNGSGYYLMIKKTGSGKSTTLSLIKNIIDKAVDYDSDISSGQALFNMISEPIYEGVGKAEKIKGYKAKPAALLSDEFSGLLSNMSISGSNLCTKLNELFQQSGKFTTNSIGNSKINGGKTRQVVTDPVLSIAGITTERAFFNGINEDLKTNGFINRYLFFPGTETMFDRVVKGGKDNVNIEMLKDLNPKRASGYKSNLYTGDFYSEEINEYLRPVVDDLLKNYNEKDSEESGILSRLHTHLHRLVLTYGMMTGNKKPTIENAAAAIEVIRLCEKYTKQLFSRENDVLPKNMFSEHKNRVENMIVNYIKRHGKTSKSDLKYQMKKRNIPEGEFEAVLKNLSDREDSTLKVASEKNDKNGLIVNFVCVR